jgi:protein-tyrosine phosphatase
VVTAYVMKKEGMTAPAALEFVRKRRPEISTKFGEQLRLWGDIRFDCSDPRVPKLAKFNADGR